MPEALSIQCLLSARLGPPRLFDGETEAGLGLPGWMLLLGSVVAIVVVVLAFRTIRDRAFGGERAAFLMLSRRFGLRKAERKAVERLAAREGVEAVGLLICESAFVRASTGQSGTNPTIVEAKPILLTNAEINELGRVAERLFGFGAMDRLEQHTRQHEEEHSDGDDERPSRWVA